MFRKRLSLSELQEPLTLVLDHWRARGGDDLACPWSKFEIHKLPPQVLPTTLVIDTFDDMSKNRFRYWGSRMTNIHDEDMTGKCPYDMSPRDFAEYLRNQHREIRDGRKATADILGFNHERGFIQAHSILRLPLSNDGRTVAHIRRRNMVFRRRYSGNGTGGQFRLTAGHLFATPERLSQPGG